MKTLLKITLLKITLIALILLPQLTNSQEIISENNQYKIAEEIKTQEKLETQKKEQKRIHMPGDQASKMLEKNANRKQEKAQEIKNETAAQKIKESAQKMIKKSDEIDTKNSQIKNKIQNKGNSKNIKHMEKHGTKGRK